jgi:putative transposase
VWRQLHHEGWVIARCTVARLMGEPGLEGIVGGKAPQMTVSDRGAPCPLERVNRQLEFPRFGGRLRAYTGGPSR